MVGERVSLLVKSVVHTIYICMSVISFYRTCSNYIMICVVAVITICVIIVAQYANYKAT